MKKNRILLWVLRVIPAIVLLQTLYFKFSASPESVFIFSALSLEPFGRIGIGIIELIVSVLLLIPRTTGIGALLGLGVIAGAILAHLFVLGIEIMNDGGYLFILSIVVFVSCALLTWIYRQQVPILNKLLKNN
ncbi:MAG: DoxX family protein [Bacteroidota bacterium]